MVPAGAGSGLRGAGVMRTYSIAATYERDTAMDAGLPDAELLIHFTFTPGCPETGPSYASGGEPACPAEVEFDHVEREADGKWIAAPEFDGWASEWLQNAGYDAACEEVAMRNEPDPDYAYERMRDERMWDDRDPACPGVV